MNQRWGRGGGKKESAFDAAANDISDVTSFVGQGRRGITVSHTALFLTLVSSAISPHLPSSLFCGVNGLLPPPPPSRSSQERNPSHLELLLTLM